MGLQLAINKQDNSMYYDFPTAYWKIEDIVFSNAEGSSYVSFALNAYPSREASKQVLKPMDYTGNISVGGASMIAYSPKLWAWEATFRTDTIFPNGIPTSESSQKDVLYVFVKQYTGLAFIDVLED